jgi:hypothetical protein
MLKVELIGQKLVVCRRLYPNPENKIVLERMTGGQTVVHLQDIVVVTAISEQEAELAT